MWYRLAQYPYNNLPIFFIAKIINIIIELLKDLPEDQKRIYVAKLNELKSKKILLIGLFGSGKTTAAAKLARFYFYYTVLPRQFHQ